MGAELPDLSSWFTHAEIDCKRENIAEIIQELAKEELSSTSVLSASSTDDADKEDSGGASSDNGDGGGGVVKTNSQQPSPPVFPELRFKKKRSKRDRSVCVCVMYCVMETA